MERFVGPVLVLLDALRELALARGQLQLRLAGLFALQLFLPLLRLLVRTCKESQGGSIGDL